MMIMTEGVFIEKTLCSIGFKMAAYITTTLLIFCCYAMINEVQTTAMYEEMFTPKPQYSFPLLPYAYNELEPHLDERTLRVHHGKHHKGYTDKMNTALEKWKQEEPGNPLLSTSIVNILQNINSVPQKWRTTLKNNGGGYVNHIYYFVTMCSSTKKGEVPPSLTAAIEENFSSMDDLINNFTSSSLSLFGSGYVWLVIDEDINMKIITTKDQDCPLSLNLYPLLTIDIWEHSYYLKHQNKRPDYINDWWNLVCWEEVEKLKLYWQNMFYKKKDEL